MTVADCTLQLGVCEGGLLSAPVGPLQSPGGGKDPGSSDNFAFYSSQNEPKTSFSIVRFFAQFYQSGKMKWLKNVGSSIVIG